MRAKDSYNTEQGSNKFMNFLQSKSGKTQQEVIFKAVQTSLANQAQSAAILDAACGTGWMSARLKPNFPNIESCDGSTFFIDYAKKTYPELSIVHADLNQTLPYSNDQFDVVIFSMAAHDIEDQMKTFAEFNRILKPKGKLLIAIVNPYYGYPVGSWKRGFWGWLLRRQAELVVKPYHWFAKQDRAFHYQDSVLTNYFYKLSEHLNNAIATGFVLKKYEDLECIQETTGSQLEYRLHRYPVILFMEFEKSGQ